MWRVPGLPIVWQRPESGRHSSARHPINLTVVVMTSSVFNGATKEQQQTGNLVATPHLLITESFPAFL